MRKRSYDDEIEDELDAIFDDEQDKDTHLDVLLSPKSKYPFSHSSMPELNSKSGILNPGSRPKARMKAKNPSYTSSTSSTASQDFDDGDVNFLQPMDCD